MSLPFAVIGTQCPSGLRTSSKGQTFAPSEGFWRTRQCVALGRRVRITHLRSTWPSANSPGVASVLSFPPHFLGLVRDFCGCQEHWVECVCILNSLAYSYFVRDPHPHYSCGHRYDAHILVLKAPVKGPPNLRHAFFQRAASWCFASESGREMQVVSGPCWWWGAPYHAAFLCIEPLSCKSLLWHREHGLYSFKRLKMKSWVFLYY